MLSSSVRCPARAFAGNLVIGGGGTSTPVGDYAAVQVPDIVGSLRVDQAWGSAQIAGALHQVRAGFYGTTSRRQRRCGPGGYTGLAPADKWGYAAMAGIVINLPWAKGDQFWIEGAYTVGADAYTGLNVAWPARSRRSAASTAATWLRRGRSTPVFGNVVCTAGLTGSLELTTVWTIGAGVAALLDPGSAFVGVRPTRRPTTTRRRLRCSVPAPNTPVRNLAGANPVAFNNVAGLAGCNPDFNCGRRHAHDLEPGTEPRYRC